MTAAPDSRPGAAAGTASAETPRPAGLHALDTETLELRTARQMAKQIERLADPDDDDLRVRAQLNLAEAAMNEGAFREAAAAYMRSIELGARTADIRIQLAYALNLAGDVGPCVQVLRDGLADPAVPPPQLIRLAITLSYALTDTGDLAGANAALEQACKIAETETLDVWARSRLAAATARLADAAGMHLLALVRIRVAINDISSTDDVVWLAKLHIIAGEYAFFADRTSDAARHLGYAVRLLGLENDIGHVDPNKVTSDTGDRLLLEMLLGFLAVARGRGEDGELAARSVLARIGGEDPQEQGRARWLLARALEQQERLEEAVIEYSTAERLSRRAMRYTARIRRDLAGVLEQLGRVDEADSLRVRAAAIDRVRRLPDRGELLLRELEARQSAQLAALGDLESRVQELERARGDQPAQGPRPPLRPI